MSARDMVVVDEPHAPRDLRDLRAPIEAVLFDLDGVLVHSEAVWFRLMEECGRVFRGRAVTREEFAPTFGQSTAEDVRTFGLACSVEELDRFYAENFRRFVGEILVSPDARPALESLSARGKPLAVVTNTATALAHEILDAAGLRRFFRAVACADQVPRAKPAPDLVLRALAALGAPPAAACLVGDSRYDREAAGAAGVRFIGLGIDGDARSDRLSALLEGALGEALLASPQAAPAVDRKDGTPRR
ncbi:HAD family hydrolase [Sorangium sp. So ce1182]|uniref:HAD family hydrolase n=1 Tax=Sorangium sp. So ce1182 TaxID=3133334 RepID=UPI003F6236EA